MSNFRALFLNFITSTFYRNRALFEHFFAMFGALFGDFSSAIGAGLVERRTQVAFVNNMEVTNET